MRARSIQGRALSVQGVNGYAVGGPDTPEVRLKCLRSCAAEIPRSFTEIMMLRKYVEDDLEDYMETWATASKLAHPFLSDAFHDQTDHDIRHTYLAMTESWVWESEGRVVGFVSLMGNEIGGLFVRPSHHRQGIGKALVDHARAERSDLEVEVFRENHIGRSFYSNYGFTPIVEKLHEDTGFPILRLKLLTDE